MNIMLFKKEFIESTVWSVDGNDLNCFVEFELFFNRHVIFCFRVSVANKSFMYRNPFKALLKCLESETISSAKYNKLKERTREINAWGSL